MCSGGFPLYLAGGAAFYSDIDLYAASWPDYYRGCKTLSHLGMVTERTAEGIRFLIVGEDINLMRPRSSQLTPEALMETADLSPSACALRLEEMRLVVETLYPQDIETRTCRVLIQHDWTDYRLEIYRRKGYTIEGQEEEES